jgi:chromosome partitioning protein
MVNHLCRSVFEKRRGLCVMNVIAFASRKGGSGKSTLTAHLAAHAHKPSRSCLLIDADPQRSLSLWNLLRGEDALPLKSVARGIESIVKAARREHDWIFIDTPPNMSNVVNEAIRAATLVVIPARPSVFDLGAIEETIALCRDMRRPYAVVINGAPAKRNEVESPIVTEARQGLAELKVPLWSGQITNRMNFAVALGAGEGVKEFAATSQAAAEIGSLWTAIERSVKAINGLYGGNARAMHRVAA